ncbi:MAG: DUF4124 domain-containing protein [Candidatus Dechloromonas phosphoritropha]
MTRPALIYALFLASTVAVAQETYKCKTPGGMVYQDRPCPGAVRRSADMPPARAESQAAKVEAAPTDATPEARKPPTSLDRDKAYLAARAKARRINDLQEQIEGQEVSISQSQQARDAELNTIKERKSLASNNLAGATLEHSLATEMQAVATRYDSDIHVKQEKLRQLREDLAKAQKE